MVNIYLADSLVGVAILAVLAAGIGALISLTLRQRTINYLWYSGYLWLVLMHPYQVCLARMDCC